MANVGLGVSNPMYIDTVATVHTGWVTIQTIVWVNDETAGDDIVATDFFELTDTAGNIIASKAAVYDGDDGEWIFPLGLKVNGLICTSIDGGISKVYCA